jgi:hypothetical protein
MDQLFKANRPGGVPTTLYPSQSTSRATRNLTSGNDNAGQFGTYIYSSYGTSGGSFGANTGYMTSELPWVWGSNILFAPTNKGADGACLEVGSGYNYNLQSAQVYAFDFCDGTPIGNLHTMKSIDSTFRSLYERNFGDGLPAYFYEVVRNPDGHWTAYLYDYTDGLWLPFYTSAGTTLNAIPAAKQGSVGWDMFETHYYANGTCPYVPEVHSFAKQYYDLATETWQYLENEPGAQYNIPPAQGTDCIGWDDGSGQGYFYSIGYNAGLHDWTVDAYQSQPPPPPDGGGGDPCDPTITDCCGLAIGGCTCIDPVICCDLYGTYCCDSFVGGPCAYDVRRSVSTMRRRQSNASSGGDARSRDTSRERRQT